MARCELPKTPGGLVQHAADRCGDCRVPWARAADEGAWQVCRRTCESNRLGPGRKRMGQESRVTDPVAQRDKAVPRRFQMEDTRPPFLSRQVNCRFSVVGDKRVPYMTWAKLPGQRSATAATTMPP